MGFFGNKPPVFDWAKDEDDESSYHFTLDLTEREKDLLLRLISHEQPRVTIKDRNYIIEKIRLAKRHTGKPLPDEVIDWDAAEREAERRGSNVVDLIWDDRGPDLAA